MGTTVVLEGVKVSELPEAWRRRVKAKANEVLTVTIAKHTTKTAAKTAKKPNATFGMWADRPDANDPAAYVRALRQPRARMEGLPMQTDFESLKQRINQLHLEHRDLDDVIARLAEKPGQDQLQLQRLKKKKLLLKDQILQLERQLTPDVRA